MNRLVGHPGGTYRRRRRPRAGAFTLIELLVVIGLLTVLIALLLPALRRARYQARMAVCTSNLRQVGVAMFAYARENNGWYPYRQCAQAGYNEPYWLAQPGGVVDDRPMFRRYFQTTSFLMCPLIPDAFDIDSVRGKAVAAGYELWGGTQWQLADQRTMMFRVGQRPLFNGKRFAVLAADIERWPASYFRKINTSHPDFQKLVPMVSSPDDNYAFDPVAALAMWHNPNGYERGPMDRNFLMDDGSVRMMRLQQEDSATQKVPYQPTHPLQANFGWLPPVD